jgi:endonuclease G
MKKLILAFSIFLVVNSWAACSKFYPKGIAMPAKTVELCSSFYVSRFDASNKATVMTVELLQKSKPTASVPRIDAYRPDSRVGAASPVNTDYSKSGFDRGHMAPAADASSPTEMYDTFLLTNMTPQAPTLNQVSWKKMEDQIRKEFDAGTVDFKVVTLAMYNKPKKIGSNIPVPAGYWKIVYVNDLPIEFYYAQNATNAPVIKFGKKYVNTLIKQATNF